MKRLAVAAGKPVAKTTNNKRTKNKNRDRRAEAMQLARPDGSGLGSLRDDKHKTRKP